MPNPTITELFFQLIQCGIGQRDSLSEVPSKEQWTEIWEIAEKQSLMGIAYSGIASMPQSQRPPKQILLSWYQVAETIKENSALQCKQCKAVSNKFLTDGFRNCILKGQGIAQYYPDPLLRNPGDIDIWLEGGYKRISEYIRRYFPNIEPVYHHMDFPIKKGLSIEVHFTPSWMHSPLKNRKLQKFFVEKFEEQCSNTANGNFPVPTTAFNRVYILLHIFRHLFQEGIGMRQMLDYYFILKQGMNAAEKEEYTRTLKELGLLKFASAVMYAMQAMFAMDRTLMPVAPDRKRGEFLVNEIMIAGNFGKYDSRYRIVSKDKEFLHFWNSMQRTARLVRQYPSEALWSPYFKVWHFFWRKQRKQKAKKK